jgi:hypothetical protein
LEPPVSADSATERVLFSSLSHSPIPPTTPLEDHEDEELVDYKTSPTHEGKNINVIYLSSTDDSLSGEDNEEVAQFDFGP